jgi:phosphohistidine phosphatase
LPIVRCYLIRHGDALAAELDPLRPLSERGRVTVAKLAQMAAAKDVKVAEICHSGILRAQQTAEILALSLRPTRDVRRIGGLLPEDDPTIGRVEIESSDEPTMLVGHLPYMGRLAALLVTGDAARGTVEFAPATMVSCSKNGSLWRMDWQINPALS